MGQGNPLFLRVLLDDAVAVGVEQAAQFFYLFLNLAALVGVAHANASAHHLHDLLAALDVSAAGYGLCGAGERLVLDEFEAAAVIDEGVACDARRVVVGLRETSVDDHQHAVGLDGVLALAGMNRHVAVDDVRADPL